MVRPSTITTSADRITIASTLPHLPANRKVERAIERTRALVRDADVEGLLATDTGLHHLIDEIQILSRAVFVVDKAGKLSYVEYVPEAGKEPNYEAALAALKAAA